MLYTNLAIDRAGKSYSIRFQVRGFIFLGFGEVLVLFWWGDWGWGSVFSFRGEVIGVGGQELGL